MAITVTSAATSSKLTTLAAAKVELNITSTAYDSRLNSLIQQASDIITRYTGRTFARQTYTETLASNGGPVLILENTPIVSISLVTDDGTTVSSTTYSIENRDAGLLFNPSGWRNTMLYVSNIEGFALGVNYGKRSWSVSYTAGYKLPGSTSASTGPTLPTDVERACLEIVKGSYLRLGADPAVKSQRTGEAWETLFDIEKTQGLPPATAALLAPWVRQL